MKQCYTCKETKPDEEYSWKVKNKKRSGVCKLCHAKYRKQHYGDNKAKYIAKAARWNKEHGRPRDRHGLNDSQYNNLLKKYNGLCWLCKNKPGTHIDHDHSCCSGTHSCGNCVRGLLCLNCNNGLGLLGDTLDSLEQAVVYLRQHQTSQVLK